jgi:parvulin-like peptidyl-prolyl isomerase
MTYRARPVAKRPRRVGWDSDERRTALINGGFVVAIIAAILILVGYAGWTYYSDHWGQAASVDGQTITRDDLRNRIAIEDFRIKYTESRVHDLLAQGKVSQSDATNQLSFLDQQLQSEQSSSLEQLIDARLQAELAGQNGVVVNDADVDAELTKEATIDEQRHVWMIEVEPTVDPATGQVGDAQKAAAKQKADAALAQIKAGAKWEDVAKVTSTATSAAQGGDLGWIPLKSGYDDKFLAAAFAAPLNGLTDVVQGDDGTYRIGRVTEIAPASVDQGFQSKTGDAGIKLDDYRQAVRADVVRSKLSDKVVADLSKPSLQRHVLEIYLPDPGQPGADAVKIRQIVFAPNGDMADAAKVPASDAAWSAAQADAMATYQELLLDPSKFDVLARAKSDDKSSRDQGGKLPYVDSTTTMQKPVADAVFAKGLRNGQILAPIKAADGWYIVQFMHPYGDGDEAWLNDLKTRAAAGIDFAQLARDNDEGPEAKDGGDLGWVVKGQLATDQETAIFGTAIGQVSDVVNVQNDGVYLFKVLEEATRTPDAKQIKAFQDTGFSNWYAAKKAAATITRDITDSSASA